MEIHIEIDIEIRLLHGTGSYIQKPRNTSKKIQQGSGNTPPTPPAGKAAPYHPHHIHIQPYVILYEYSSVAHLTNTTREPYDTYCAIHTVIPPPQHPNPRNNNTSREQGSLQVTPRQSDTAKSTLHDSQRQYKGVRQSKGSHNNILPTVYPLHHKPPTSPRYLSVPTAHTPYSIQLCLRGSYPQLYINHAS